MNTAVHPPPSLPLHRGCDGSVSSDSERAVAMSTYVVRAFVRLRRELLTSATLELRLTKIEKELLSHDDALRGLYAKIKPLLLPPPEPPSKEMGFHTRLGKR